MAEENSEICGFLNVKYLNGKSKVHKIKKKTLAPWKVWQRHWCSIKKLGPGLGVKIQFDYVSNGINTLQNDKDTSLVIPSDAIICRTQSRSKQFAFGIFPTKDKKPVIYFAGNSEVETQRWMTNIRQLLRPRRYQCTQKSYNISLVDNLHSKASGFIGLYGDLITSTIGVSIKDAHSGNLIETFEWKELGQFHYSTAGHPEDVKCICVIHTTKEFRGGIGELHVFCLEADKLLQELVTQGRGPRPKNNRRPLSLSEGDLRILRHEEVQGNYLISNEGMDVRILNKNSESTTEDKEMSLIYNKLVENVYQSEPLSVPNIPSGIREWPGGTHDRRISNISVASGIYEEIADEIENNKATTSYFCRDQIFKNCQSEEPPPLPPRQRCASESMKDARSKDIFLSERSLLLTMSIRNSGQTEKDTFTPKKAMDICNYVPMSPRLKDITLHHLQAQSSLQENDYVIMR